MPQSRREFLADTSLGLLGVAFPTGTQNPADLPPGAPPAFGTAPAVGPEGSRQPFVNAGSSHQRASLILTWSACNDLIASGDALSLSLGNTRWRRTKKQMKKPPP